MAYDATKMKDWQIAEAAEENMPSPDEWQELCDSLRNNDNNWLNIIKDFWEGIFGEGTFDSDLWENWLTNDWSSGGCSVPEPSSALLLAAGGVVLYVTRRRNGIKKAE